MGRARVIIGFVVGVLVAANLVPAASAATPSAYVTLAFGRSRWVSTRQCTRMPNTIDLGQVATELTRRHMFGVGNVVLDRTLETSRLCFNQYAQQTSWADIQRLHTQNRWTFVS